MLVQVNDAPVVDLNGAATGTSTTVSYTENDALSVIAPSAIVTDIDSTDFNGGSLRVAFTQNGTNADQLSIKADATVSMSGNTVSVNGTAIGSVSGGTNGSDLVVSFNGSATPALVTLLLQHIGYSNSSDAPSTAARTVKFTMIDGDGTALGGQDTGFATATINVTAANDRPVANNVVANGNEDANSISVKLTGSDVDGTVASFKVTGPLPDASQGTLYADSAMTNAVVSGTSYAASSANALTLYFKPTANYNGTVIFNYTATDNSGAEVAASATATINVASVNDAPKIVTYLKVTGWGWFYLSTVLDDFSRYIAAWKLCTTMKAEDVTDTLELALQASGLDQVNVAHRPRLLSDNGPSYVSVELAAWLDKQDMPHIRGAPYHPMTQGKIERWHLTLKNRILLENYYLPGQLEARIEAFVAHYNHLRYHESIDNLTPADVYFGRGQTILLERERIKRKTIQHRRLHHKTHAA